MLHQGSALPSPQQLLPQAPIMPRFSHDFSGTREYAPQPPPPMVDQLQQLAALKAQLQMQQAAALQTLAAQHQQQVSSVDQLANAIAQMQVGAGPSYTGGVTDQNSLMFSSLPDLNVPPPPLQPPQQLYHHPAEQNLILSSMPELYITQQQQQLQALLLQQVIRQKQDGGQMAGTPLASEEGISSESLTQETFGLRVQSGTPSVIPLSLASEVARNSPRSLVEAPVERVRPPPAENTNTSSSAAPIEGTF